MRAELNETEFGIFLNEEIARLDNLTRPTWKKHRSPTRRLEGRKDGQVLGLMAVARAGNEAIVYDSSIEEFGVAILEGEEVKRWTTYGPTLRDTLRHFPRAAE
jgi:hypothetical protein